VWEATFEDLCRSARERNLDARAFAQRRSEFEILFRHVRVPPGRALEVGCGGGFLTALLAREGKAAVGIDMAAPDDTTHSRGMDAPAKVRKALGAPNLHFLGCSGEALCFADGAFDLVLSSYVLEHVADRAGAVREMKRVAGPDALIVALVPAWMERVYAPFIYYPRMIAGILRSASRHAARRLGAPRPPAAPPAPSRAGAAPAPPARPEGVADKIRKFFRVYHPTFPFPRPHGLYRSSTEELLAHRYGRWAGLFEGEGLVIERAFATRVAPTCLLEAISDEADSAVQKRFVGLLGRRGESPWLRRFAYSFCFVLRKPAEGRPQAR
jgi:SAM-dependent methyltransferase